MRYILLLFLAIATQQAHAWFFQSDSKYNNFFGLKLGMAEQEVKKDSKYSMCKKRIGPKKYEELGYTEYACEKISNTMYQLILGFYKGKLVQIIADGLNFGGKESYDAILGKFGNPTHEYPYSQFPVGTKREEMACDGRCTSFVWEDTPNKVRAAAVAIPSLKTIVFLQVNDLKALEEYGAAEQQQGRKTAEKLGY